MKPGAFEAVMLMRVGCEIPSGPGSIVSRTEAGYMEAVTSLPCGYSNACRVGGTIYEETEEY